MANAETTQGILGVFKYLDRCVASIQELKASGRDKLEVFSPVPSHEIQDALGIKPSRLGYATLAGAVFGLVALSGLVSNVELGFFGIDLNDQPGRIYWLLGCCMAIVLGVLFVRK